MASVLLVLNPTIPSATYDLEAACLTSNPHTCEVSENRDLSDLFNMIFNEGILPEESLDFNNATSSDDDEISDLITQIESELMITDESEVKHVEIMLEDGDDKNYIERNLREAFPEIDFVFQEPIIDTVEVNEFDRQLAKEIKYFEGVGITPESNGILKLERKDDMSLDCHTYVLAGLTKHFRNIYINSDGMMHTSRSRESILSTLADIVNGEVDLTEGFPEERSKEPSKESMGSALEALRELLTNTLAEDSFPIPKITADIAADMMLCKMSSAGATRSGIYQVSLDSLESVLSDKYTTADVAAKIHEIYSNAIVTHNTDVFVSNEGEQKLIETRLLDIRDNMGPNYDGTMCLVSPSHRSEVYLNALNLAISLKFPGITLKSDDNQVGISIQQAAHNIIKRLRDLEVPSDHKFVTKIDDVIDGVDVINPSLVARSIAELVHKVYHNAVLRLGDTGYANKHSAILDKELHNAPHDLTDVQYTSPTLH